MTDFYILIEKDVHLFTKGHTSIRFRKITSVNVSKTHDSAKDYVVGPVFEIELARIE